MERREAVLGVPVRAAIAISPAIVHGHPVGTTGAVLATRLRHAMQRNGLRLRDRALRIGGGQGIAPALEGHLMETQYRQGSGKYCR